MSFACFADSASVFGISPSATGAFPPRAAPPNLAGTHEHNQGGLEVRVWHARAATPEAVDFPGVEPVALRRRKLQQHPSETVALVTSLPPERLPAAQWLKDNRAAWGIESGRHQRLAVSPLDDQSRVRTPRSMRGMGEVPAVEQEPVPALARPAEETAAQNRHGLSSAR